MLYAFLCQDRPGALQVRLDARPEHLEWLNGLNAEGKLAFAGPFVGQDGNSNGSLVMVEAASMEEAKTLAAADPYARAGLFASVEVRPWNWTFNKPEV